jgi:hypothetical protein
MDLELRRRLFVLDWHNFWLDFGGAPFTAKTFPC